MTISIRSSLAGLIAALAFMATPLFAADMPSFNLVIRDGHFIPENLEVPANTKFRLLIKNEGPGAEEFESADLQKEKVLAPGASSFLIFQPLKPGTYKFFGEFHPKTAQGRMVAK
ncbi:MAG TPA: cupredoxin domain-containing protein [Paucimonas sp.]|nr:cupredoxin domain-containing protein [Paucimonas sp.]HJW56246.1 cupredoxin domain-containing protein [Burkholderiaceae bacterium]